MSRTQGCTQVSRTQVSWAQGHSQSLAQVSLAQRCQCQARAPRWSPEVPFPRLWRHLSPDLGFFTVPFQSKGKTKPHSNKFLLLLQHGVSRKTSYRRRNVGAKSREKPRNGTLGETQALGKVGSVCTLCSPGTFPALQFTFTLQDHNRVQAGNDYLIQAQVHSHYAKKPFSDF